MKWPVTLFVIVIPQIGISQGIGSVLDKSTNPGEVLVEFDDRESTVLGDHFLFREWFPGDVILSSGTTVTNQKINYDIQSDRLEINLENQVKIVPASKLGYFVVIDSGQNRARIFRGCNNFTMDDHVPLEGICEVVDSNYFGLVIKYSSEIKKATYVPALDMGNQNAQVIQQEQYFLSFGNRITPLPRKKSEFIKLYYPRVDDVERYIKENKLNHKNRMDLLKILTYLNNSSN